MMRAMHLALLAPLILIGAARLPLQAAQEDGQEPEQELVRLTAWPELPKRQRKQVDTDIARLRKAHTPEMGEQARVALLQVGAAVVPRLLEKLGKEKDEDALERIDVVITALTGPAHTRLLAEEFSDKSQVVRTWALSRVAAFPDPGIREAAEGALDRAAKVKEPDKADSAEHLAAALAATSGGSSAGLKHLFERARKGWGKHGPAMRTALEGVRGEEATAVVFAQMRVKGSERLDTIAGLNMLAGCGDRAAAQQIKAFLSDTDNSIRIAAINALRGIVDGALPLDRLPVFKAIELAEEWRRRV